MFLTLKLIYYFFDSRNIDAELESWKGAGRPVTSAQEAEDERHDAELLAAVRTSMKQWEIKRSRTRFDKLYLHIVIQRKNYIMLLTNNMIKIIK